MKGEDLIDQAQEIDFAAMVAASGPNVEQLVAENARRVVRDKQAQGATLTVVLQKAKGLQRVNGLLEGPRPDVFVTVEVENEELFTSPLRCDLGVPSCRAVSDRVERPRRAAQVRDHKPELDDGRKWSD